MKLRETKLVVGDNVAGQRVELHQAPDGEYMLVLDGVKQRYWNLSNIEDATDSLAKLCGQVRRNAVRRGIPR